MRGWCCWGETASSIAYSSIPALVFVVSLGFYITPAMLGGGKVLMFAMVIEQQVREFLAWNFAGALSVILLALTLLVFWLLNQGVARRLGD
jgi:ABC-type spermidine/putrescine transport system permease subunit I